MTRCTALLLLLYAGSLPAGLPRPAFVTPRSRGLVVSFRRAAPTENWAETVEPHGNAVAAVNCAPPTAVGTITTSRTALPKITTSLAAISDFASIADLRLSVFTPYGDPVRQRYRVRAREKMIERRMKGATCIVARVDGEVARGGEAMATAGAAAAMATLSGDPTSAAEAKSSAMQWAQGTTGNEEGGSGSYDRIVGTLECSTHEFDRAPLRGYEGERFYVTEVAVAPHMRRRGVALKMIHAAEQVAVNRGVRVLYLHVDAHNDAAIRLYLRAGFQRVEETMETFNFASALGLLSGSFANADHLLLAKKVGKALFPPAPSEAEVDEHLNLSHNPPRSLVKDLLDDLSLSAF
mmetsp:Transcript_7457/g.18976  ORF Transcript_7457/g.18976 Transcript_7457/m.18976 type:complete len:351 (-) Transcript_7457:432-1484(-)